MHPFVLVVCTIAALVVLPRLANHFREPRQDIIASLQAPREMAVKALPAVPASFPSSVEDPVAVMAIAAAPKAKEEPHRYAAPPVPATEQELIAAIQRELVRLGYYNGPITTRWNGGVRAAARKFTGARRPIPAQGLLMALRAVKPEAKPNATGQRSVLNLQSAQDLLNGRAPASSRQPYAGTRRRAQRRLSAAVGGDGRQRAASSAECIRSRSAPCARHSPYKPEAHSPRKEKHVCGQLRFLSLDVLQEHVLGLVYLSGQIG